MNVAENIKHIRTELDAAACKAGRNPSDIKLISVSKTKPVGLIREAVSCGMLDFGENKPQELAEKFTQLNGDIRWHMIGHLQKNKVKHIIDKTALIHSVDSFELAAEISKRAAAINKIQDILIQVNISGEDSKFGIKQTEASELCKRISELENVHINGLMTISIRGLDFGGNKQIFSSLAELSAKIDAQNISNVTMKELSMGMSHDFDAAIAAGSTMVRIGSAIFGARDYDINL